MLCQAQDNHINYHAKLEQLDKGKAVKGSILK